MASIKNIKTDFTRIAIASILVVSVTFFLFLIAIFGFWGIYGEGATASRISELWYVDLILNFSPIAVVGSIMIYKIWSSYKKEKYVKYKAYLITLIILIIVYSLKGHLMKIFF